jgi:hypothetical protein
MVDIDDDGVHAGLPANRMSEQVRSVLPEAVTLEDLEGREVAAHA